MRLSKLVESLEFVETVALENGEMEIQALSVDSRKKQKNSLFVCLRGAKTDAHEYAAEAIKNGAVAIVAEEKLHITLPQIIVKDTRAAIGILSSVFYGEPCKRLKIIGITGTNGKTTTAHMLEAILERSGKKVGIIGTLGIRYGKKIISAELTTPDPIVLFETLADMCLCGVQYVVMEVSAHALYYQKTVGVDFFACIFTNLTQDHLDFFPSMEEYKASKLRLFSKEVCPIAIVNGDDTVGREIGRIRDKEGAKTVYYGLNSPADCFAIITDETRYGTECMLNLNDKLCRVSLSMVGLHNVYNALAASACAQEMGLEQSAIAAGLHALKSVNGRLQRVGELRGADVYVDFAHTPDGLGKSIDALKKHCKGRLICLFGCGGNRDKAKRPIMGEIAAKKADFCVLTSDNPRYEDPLDIISDVEKGYRRFSSYYVVVPDRKKAIEYALDVLKKEDILLVAGKGGEDYQEIMGIKYAFNDYTVIENLLVKKQRNPLA